MWGPSTRRRPGGAGERGARAAARSLVLLVAGDGRVGDGLGPEDEEDEGADEEPDSDEGADGVESPLRLLLEDGLPEGDVGQALGVRHLQVGRRDVLVVPLDERAVPALQVDPPLLLLGEQVREAYRHLADELGSPDLVPVEELDLELSRRGALGRVVGHDKGLAPLRSVGLLDHLGLARGAAQRDDGVGVALGVRVHLGEVLALDERHRDGPVGGERHVVLVLGGV
mmetsp:Transcript_11116/g.27265  ORF Transcript_11116/g.27265 Transcript_11116/m.27265 type:complete len:227 (-) Transcript_11116:1028-1708(-)